MLSKEITFLYTDKAEFQQFEPIAKEAEKEDIRLICPQTYLKSARIGFIVSTYFVLKGRNFQW